MQMQYSPSIYMTEEMFEGIDDRRTVKIPRSEWIRGAIEIRFLLQDLADEHDVELDEEWVRAAAEEYLAENDPDAHPPKAEP